MTQSLHDLAKRIDALTYLNAIKVTLQQLKTEESTQEELRGYMNESAERKRKLMKKIDSQYRLFARIVTRDPAYAADVTMDETQDYDKELKEVMESE